MSTSAATVIGEQPVPATPATPAAPAAAAVPAITADEAAALRKEIADLKTTSDQNMRTAQFWHEKATKGEKPAAAAPAEDDPDVLDLITSKGAKGLDELLKKRGYVRADDVDGKIETRANQIVREAALVKQYPELEDKKSDFFTTTAKHYGALTKSGVPPGEAMALAAERTELEMLRTGKMKTPAQKSDEDKAQKEADRKARAAAQSGDRGGPPRGGEGEDEDLTPEQKRIAASMGITEERYKARAKQGVAIRGGLR